MRWPCVTRHPVQLHHALYDERQLHCAIPAHTHDVGSSWLCKLLGPPSGGIPEHIERRNHHPTGQRQCAELRSVPRLWSKSELRGDRGKQQLQRTSNQTRKTIRKRFEFPHNLHVLKDVGRRQRPLERG